MEFRIPRIQIKNTIVKGNQQENYDKKGSKMKRDFVKFMDKQRSKWIRGKDSSKNKFKK